MDDDRISMDINLEKQLNSFDSSLIIKKKIHFLAKIVNNERNRVKVLVSRSKKLEADNEQLEELFLRSDEDRKRIAEQNKKLVSQLEISKNEIKALKEEMNGIIKDNSKKKSSITEQQREFEMIKSQNEQLEQKNQEYELKMNDILKQNESLKRQLSSIHKEVDSFREMQNSLQADLQNSRRNSKIIETRCKNAEHELIEKTKEKERLVIELNKTKGNLVVDNSNCIIFECVSLNDFLKDENQALIEDNQALSIRIKQVSKKCVEFEQQNIKLLREIQSKQSLIDECQSSRERAISKIRQTNEKLKTKIQNMSNTNNELNLNRFKAIEVLIENCEMSD